MQSMVKMKPASSPCAATRHPAKARSSAQMPGGGPQSAVDGEDEARELPARRHSTPSQGQMPGGGPQSAVDGEDEAYMILDMISHMLS